jgi:hypothetical protein
VDAAAGARRAEPVAVSVRADDREAVIVELESARAGAAVARRPDQERVVAVVGDAAIAAAAVPANPMDLSWREAAALIAAHDALVGGADDADHEVEAPLGREAEANRGRAFAVEVDGARGDVRAPQLEPGARRIGGRGGRGTGEERRGDRQRPAQF